MANWGNVLGGGTAGALGGAAAGAAAGSFFPVVGTGIGAAAGALLGMFGGSAPGLLESSPDKAGGIPNKQTGNLFTGYDAYNQQLPRFTPEQQNTLNMLLQQGGQNANFGGIENRAREQFSKNTIPGLAERFTAMGSGGSQRSSAFQGALGSAGADLESQLAALRGQYGMQQLGLGLQPSFENIYNKREGGIAQGAASGLGQATSQIPTLISLYMLLNKMGTGTTTTQ